MDKTLLRPLFKKRYLELNPPRGFKAGAAIDFQQLAMGNQNKKDEQDNTGIMNIITNPVSGVQEDVTLKPRENTEEVKNLFLPEKVVQERKTEQQNLIDVGEQVKKNPSLFSDNEKLGIFAALLSQGLARPGPITETLGPALGSAALGLADIKATEAELQGTKEGKTRLMFDQQIGMTYLVPESQALSETMEIDGVSVPRFIEKPSDTKDSIETVKANILDPETGKLLETDKRILKTDLAAYNRGDYSKFKKGSLNFEDMKDIKGVIISDNSVLGKRNQPVSLDPMTFKMYQNRGEVAIGLSEDEKARIEAEQAYFIKEDVEYQKRIAEVNKQLTKTDDALFLINDIKGKLNAQGAYGGGLNTLSQFIGNAKATGKFLFGVGDKKISVDPKDTKNPTFRTVDPDFDANFADIKKAILDPDEYINSVVNIGNEKRIMTEAEKERFRGATRLFRQEFANVNAALQTNIIQLAYAIAKANEEGGRFSVSDIEFAMQSIGNGSNLEQFNSKLNTVAARVAANAYKRADGLYTEMSNVKRDYIRNTAEEKRKNDVFKRIEKNYRFYLGKDEDPDDRKSSDVPNLEQRLQQRQKNKGP